MDINDLLFKLILKLGIRAHKYDRIPDNIYNRMRYYYHDNLPSSFYLLFDNLNGCDDALKCLLLTIQLPKNSDYKICHSITRSLGDHYYIVCDGLVYDPYLDIVAEKEFYDLLVGPANPVIVNKDDIIRFINEKEIGKGSYESLQDINMETIYKIEKQYKEYQGKRTDLIERQVESYFKDINYKNGIMYLNERKR